MEYLIRVAKAENCDAIFNVGDFGYWPHTEDGQRYLRKVNRMLANGEDHDFTLYWIDGNHENFDWLFCKELKHNAYYPVSLANGMYSIGPNVRYVPRGYTFVWDGVKFLAMGGAISIDKAHRRTGSSWWMQEALTKEDVERGINNAQNGSQELADVLICHDAPSYVDVPLHGGLNDYVSKVKALDAETAINRSLLTTLVEAVRPKQIYHGHYHIRHENPYYRPGLSIPCLGLNCDGSMKESWTVFDTEEWKNK